MNAKSQQHVLGSLIIIILLLFAIVPALVFVNLTDIVKANIFEDYEHGWNHHIRFIINHDYIDEDLTSFPILVVLNSTIGAAADGGDSLRFLDDDLMEVFYHQIDEWDPTGNSYVWVRINRTSSTEDTHVVMFYGNATAIGQNSTNVWDSHYLGVWHMSESSGTVYDSTSYNRDATVGNAPIYHATGKVGYGIDFEQDNSDYLNVLDDTAFESLSALTISFFCNIESDSTGGIFTKDKNGAYGDTYFHIGYEAVANKIGFVMNHDNPDNQEESTTCNVTMGSMHSVVATWNSNHKLKLVINDSVEGLSTNTFVNIADNADVSTSIGRRSATFGAYYDGVLDELRVSDIERNESWLKASFHSQNQTAGFFAWNGGIDSGIVNTNATTNTSGNTTATLNGYLLLNGSATTTCGFRYGVNADSLATNVTAETDVANGTAFDYAVTGLSEGTVYFVQAWANNSNGFSVGNIKIFWTNSAWADSSLINRTRIVINHTFIDEDLYDFPVLVTINSTVGQYCDNGNSIRFYKNSTVQYYYEIDTWNSTENSSVWVNVTHVYDDVDTVFYLYYNDTNAVSNSSSKTWDDNFVGVWHMSESTYTFINDSTSYNNDVVGGTGCTFQQTGQVGYAVDFDRASNAYLNISDAVSLEPTIMTIECWTNFETVGINQMIISKQEAVADIGGYLLYFTNTSKYRFQAGTDAAWQIIDIIGDTAFADTGNWRYAAARSGSVTAYLNVNTTVDGSASGISIGDTVRLLWLGRDVYGNANSINGLIDEIRISKIVRSDSWLNASYHSQNQTTGFLTFAGEESIQSSDDFLVNGLTNNRITWLGQPNSYAWCNASGTANETMELNMTINATTNITQIYVWIGDSNNTGKYLNASNISAVFSSDNSTWDTIAVNTTSFIDGGSNITLNISRWTDTNGMYGTNPFNGTGLTDKTVSIFCRFRLDILIAQTVDIYWNSTTWKIRMGYII